MGENEVTNHFWNYVMDGYNVGSEGNLPKEVSWYEAIAFCNRLSWIDNKQLVYSISDDSNSDLLNKYMIPETDNEIWNAVTQDLTANGYRLPTDAEWMWAAMGADKTTQPNTSGYRKAFAGSTGSNSIDDYAWYEGNSDYENWIHTVGIKYANELGLRDMSGNLKEWCWDWSGFIDSGTATNPTGSTNQGVLDLRVVHGGSSWDAASECSIDHSLGIRSYFRGVSTGFRVVCP